MAIVQAPRILPRVVPMPSEICGGDAGFVFLSSILHAHVGKLFPGMKVKDCHQFRLTRDSDLTVDEEDLKNLRAAIQNELHDREYGDGVRLEVADTCPAHIHDFLLAQFKLTSAELYQVKGPVNLVRLNAVPDLVDRPDLKFPPRNAGRLKALRKNGSVFKLVKQSPILLHHPYQSLIRLSNDTRGRSRSGCIGRQNDHLPHRQQFRACTRIDESRTGGQTGYRRR